MKGHLKRSRMTQISASKHLPVRSDGHSLTHSLGQKLIKPISAKKDTIWKGISRGAEWHNTISVLIYLSSRIM